MTHYMPKGFKVLTEDISFPTYGGKFYRKIADGVYHMIDFQDLIDAMGDDAKTPYYASLSEIDLNVIPQNVKDSAVGCCGWSDDQIAMIDSGSEVGELMLVESINTYMGGAPMGQYDGSNYRDILKAAADESWRLSGDADYHDAQMRRPVNRIGSTAKEAMIGDHFSPMIRGIARNDVAARIMGKMHGLKDADLDEIKGDEDLIHLNEDDDNV